MASIVFYILATIVLGGALMMISSRNMVHSIVWMVTSFVGVAGIFILLQAEFVAAVQVLVYAGGIVVLFLFVVMLVNVGEIRQLEYLHNQWVPASLLAVVLFAELGFLLWGATTGETPGAEETEAALRSAGAGSGIVGNTETIGMTLYRDYLLPFEIASVLLLVAMIGAIYLARRRA